MTGLRILSAFAAFALLPWVTMAQTGGSDTKVFVGFRLVDVDRGAVVDDAAMVVRGGRIEGIGRRRSITLPPLVAPIDLKGAYVIPGLISTHVHVSDVDGDRPRAYTAANTERQLGVFARYGVTTVLSLDGEQAPAFAARDAQAVPSLDRARLFVSGRAIVGKTPEEARQMVATVAALGPDIIKIRVDDNLGTTAKMAPEVYRAVIDEAHRLRLRVAAHLFYLDDAKALLRAGVDMIAHSVRDREIDDEFIRLMKARNVPYCPTLTRDLSTFVYESTPEFFADPFFLSEADPGVVARLQEPARQKAMQASASAQRYKSALDVARRNLDRASKAGLRIAMGTDAGPFPERFQGYFEHLELTMMAESGMTPAQALRAATSDAARAIKVAGVGSLVKGAWADFVALERNPLEDIRHARSMTGVWIAGNRVPPRPARTAAPGPLETMADAERAFAAAAAQRGVRAAFLEFLDADAVDLDTTLRPAREVWTARPVPANPLATTLSWEPRTGDIAASGELGWLTGPFTVVPNGDVSKAGYGCYFSVWRQRAGQPWRVLLDYGTPTGEPCGFPAPGFVPAHGEARATSTPGTRESLLAADRAIGAIPPAEWSARAPAAFAQQARLHRPGLQPMIGRTAIAAYAATHAAPRRATTLDGDVAASGDMGYTYGRVELDGSGAAATGYYLRVWQRRGGEWTIVAEVQKPGN